MLKNRTFSVLIWAGLLLALALVATNNIVSRAAAEVNTISKTDPASQYQAPPTPTPTLEAISHPGSTDGIMLMGIIIVIIILLPIIFRRGTWIK